MGEAERLAAEKAAARERFRRLRASLPASVRAEASLAAIDRLLMLPEVAEARTVLAYWPLTDRGEVDLRPVLSRLVAEGRTVALPATGPGRTLTPRRYHDEGALVAGPFGTREPPASAPALAPEAVDVVIVPGLAMGRDGSRIGYGGGYYDAFLPTTPAFRLGVVWPGALVDALPAGPHDARLHAVVTDTEAVRVPPPGRNPCGPEA